MPLWVTLQSKRTPTFCAHFSEIRASHCFRLCPAHKRRSPKNRHGVAMLFKTGSSPWEAGAQGTEYLFVLNNLLFVLLLLVTAPTLPHFPAMGVSGANTSANDLTSLSLISLIGKMGIYPLGVCIVQDDLAHSRWFHKCWLSFTHTPGPSPSMFPQQLISSVL